VFEHVFKPLLFFDLREGQVHRQPLPHFRIVEPGDETGQVLPLYVAQADALAIDHVG